MRILVTAGPTREFIDSVRFISNPSSGRMGFEVACAAEKFGHRVVLISGPVELAAPEGIEFVKVISAQDMARECLSRFPGCDAVVMTAAVCDYKPVNRESGKIKKTPGRLRLDLVRTVDILARMGMQKENQVLVGFALEVGDGRENALAKLASKNLDFIVLNSPQTFASETISCWIFGRGGGSKEYRNVTKGFLAEEIVKMIESVADGGS